MNKNKRENVDKQGEKVLLSESEDNRLTERLSSGRDWRRCSVRWCVGCSTMSTRTSRTDASRISRRRWYVTDLWRASVDYEETAKRHKTLTTTGTSKVSPMTIDVLVVVVVVVVVASTFTSLRFATDISDNTCWLGHAQLIHTRPPRQRWRAHVATLLWATDANHSVL